MASLLGFHIQLPLSPHYGGGLLFINMHSAKGFGFRRQMRALLFQLRSSVNALLGNSATELVFLVFHVRQFLA